MGVTKKYFHFFMAYHLAYTEDCKAKNILKFYSKKKKFILEVYIKEKLCLSTLPLQFYWPPGTCEELGRQSISALPWVSNIVISLLFTYISDV